MKFVKELLLYLSAVIFLLMAQVHNAQAGWGDSDAGCQFKFDQASNFGKLYVNSNQAYFLQHIEDVRYGDTEEIYDAITCKEITSGVSAKSSFAATMAKNNFEEINLNTINNSDYVNQAFSMYVSLMPANGKIRLNINKVNADQQQAVNALNEYMNTAAGMDRGAIDTLKSDALLQKMLHAQNGYSAKMHKLALHTAESDFVNAKEVYLKNEVAKKLASYPTLQSKYTALTLEKGGYSDIYPLAANGDNEALSMAFKTAENPDQYRQAESLLVQKIKDKLIAVSVNVGGGTVTDRTWHENRLFGRTTDEAEVRVLSNISYRTSLNTALYNPKYPITVKVKLQATVSYNGSSDTNYDLILTSRLGGGQSVDSGTAKLDWEAARVGAGSWAKQNYRFNNYSFRITDISVE